MKLSFLVAATLLQSILALRMLPPKKPQCIDEPVTQNPCGDYQIRCTVECPFGLNADGCKDCICLPPTNSSCPQLLACREGCSYAKDKGGCPYCSDCPPIKEGCKVFECPPGSILGNPDADGCDVCVLMPLTPRIPINLCPRLVCIGTLITVPGKRCPICIRTPPVTRPCPRIACSRKDCTFTPEIDGKCPECVCPPCPRPLCDQGCTLTPEVNGMECPKCQC